MSSTAPSLSADLGDHQPSVSSAVRVVRLGGVAAGLGGVALAIGAWATGGMAWLVAYLAYSVVLFAGIAMASSIPRRQQKRLDREWARRFHELAIRDDLTGLHNRRYFNQQLDAQIVSCRESRRPLTVALLDLNDFKSINDTHGHHAGDAALQTVASCITRCLNGESLAARTGGDEFAVIFPGLLPDDAWRQVKSIQACLDATVLPFATNHAVSPRLNAAVGLASLDDFSEADRLLHLADDALYANKRELAQLYDRRKAS